MDMEQLKKQIEDEDFVIRLRPYADDDGKWSGEIDISIMAFPENQMDDDDYGQVMHFCKMMCATVPIMEESKEIRDIVHDYVMKVSIWKVEPNIYYTLSASSGLLRSGDGRHLFSDTLAPLLLAPRGFVSGVHELELPDRYSSLITLLLERLQAADIVEQRKHPWHFSTLGHESVKMGNVLSGTALARADLRRLPPLELTIYELMRMLDSEGWEHKMTCNDRAGRVVKASFYNGGGPDCSGKGFYSSNARTSLSRCYLVYLGLWDQHKKQVWHLQKALFPFVSFCV